MEKRENTETEGGARHLMLWPTLGLTKSGVAFTCVITFLMAFIAGCSKDPFDAQLLEGAWEMTEMYSETGTRSILFYGDVSEFPITLYTENIDFVATFSRNPDQFSMEGTYTRITSSEAPFGGPSSLTTLVHQANTGDWILRGDLLLLQGNGLQEFKVLAIERQSLHLQMMYKNTIQSGFSGASVDRATMIMAFKRQ